MKKAIFTLISFIIITGAMAQLDDGVIAPNWTLTDINGQSYTLYDYLDSGKVVVIDVSAVWCGPCWAYHNTHALRDVYNNYGPNGTNEMMVFFIEGDGSSNVDCLYGLSSCNHPYGTQGDWVTGTPYPIINSTAINNDYNINYFPTIYMICPDHVITEIGQKTEAEIYNLAQGCPPLTTNVNDVKIFDLIEPQGDYCSGTITGEIEIQNYGTDPLTSLTIYEIIDGNYYDTLIWTGNLDIYETEVITMPETGVLQDGSHTINFEIINPNGNTDENPADNTVSSTFSTNSIGSVVNVKIRTDSNPGQTSWEILDDNNNVVASGGNYSDASHIYQEEACLYADSCYTFVVYDSDNNGFSSPGFALVQWNSQTLVSCSSTDFTSDEISLNFCLQTGIEENSINSSFMKVYPVPATGITTVYSDYFEINKTYTVSLYNSLGQKVMLWKKQADNNIFTIDFKSVDPGVYFLIVSGNDIELKQQIIITK